MSNFGWIILGILIIALKSISAAVNIEKGQAKRSFWDGIIIGLWATIVIFRIAASCGATFHF